MSEWISASGRDADHGTPMIVAGNRRRQGLREMRRGDWRGRRRPAALDERLALDALRAFVGLQHLLRRQLGNALARLRALPDQYDASDILPVDEFEAIVAQHLRAACH